MHLGYHELRNMLSKFKEEREKRKMGAPSSAPTGVVPASAGPRSGSEHRSSRGGEDYRDRDRDRGYDRQTSRYELVVLHRGFRILVTDLSISSSERRRDRERSRSPRRRY